MLPARLCAREQSVSCPEGVALAYLVLQSKENCDSESPPDLIALYRKCLEVVTGPDIDAMHTFLH